MPTETGIFTEDDAKDGHIFSYEIARFIGKTLKQFGTYINIHDVGCGLGTYAGYLEDIGFTCVTGIDGYKPPIPGCRHFITKDLTKPFNPIDKAEGHVVCLEVGEHIPEDKINTFLMNIDILMGKGCLLFLSWAVPGQAGTGHISCKKNETVISMMLDRGYTYEDGLTREARERVEGFVRYFKDTLMIFKKQ